MKANAKLKRLLAIPGVLMLGLVPTTPAVGSPSDPIAPPGAVPEKSILAGPLKATKHGASPTRSWL
jgi:hypothetical protein